MYELEIGRLNRVEEFPESNEAKETTAKTRGPAVGSTWKKVSAETSALTRLVQGGRRVTKEQMQEVEQTVRMLNGTHRE